MDLLFINKTFFRWRFNESINEGNANTLARQGVDDMKLLARRYKAKYPDVLQNYDERSYYVSKN